LLVSPSASTQGVASVASVRSKPLQAGSPEIEWIISGIRYRLGIGSSPDTSPAELDWRILFETARRNGILTLLEPAVTARGADGIPPDVRSRFFDDVRAASSRSIALTSELLSLLDALGARGIRAVPYKGPVLSQVAYGNLNSRMFGDLDLLVQSDDVERAIGVLSEHAYRPGWAWTPRQLRYLLRNGHDFTMTRDLEHVVELQWAIGNRAHVVPRGVRGLLDRSTFCDIGGHQVRTLAPTDQVVVLSIHGSIHLWTRLSWICDFVMACTNVSGVDFVRAARLARSLRSERMLLLATNLAESVLGVCIDEGLCARARSDENVKGISRQLQEPLLRRGGPDIRTARNRVLNRVQLADTMSDGLRGLLASVTSPTPSDFRCAMPNRLFALYYPYRLGRLALFTLNIHSRDAELVGFDAH
jgi:hypothetical protein